MAARWTLEIAFREREKVENVETRLLYHADENLKEFLDEHKKM